MPSVRARRRWFALGLLVLWLLVAGFAGPYSGKLTEVEKNDNAAFLPKTAESTEVNDLQQRFVDQDTTPGIILWERESGITAADRALATRQLAEVRAVPKVVSVTPLIPSQDGRALQAVVQLAGTDGTELTDAANAVRDEVQGGDGLAAYVTGPAGLLADLIAAFEGIDSTLLLVTGVVVIVILLLVYRSPVLSIFPVLSVGFALLAGRRAGLPAGRQRRAHAERAEPGHPHRARVRRRHRLRAAAHLPVPGGAAPARGASTTRCGRRCAGPGRRSSPPAITVILGLLCLLFSDLSSNQSLGPVAAHRHRGDDGGDAHAAAGAAGAGRPAGVLAVRARGTASAAAEAQGFWSRVARFVGRHARAVAVVVVLVLVGLSFGISQLRVERHLAEPSRSPRRPSR